jgi:hypothetical protein
VLIAAFGNNKELFQMQNSNKKVSLGTANSKNKIHEINGMELNTSDAGTTPLQGKLFHVELQVEIEDIEMGVLESGVPYLTGRGLAKMCGIDHGPFHRLTSNWSEEKFKPRGRAIQQLLDQSRYTEQQLYLKAELNGNEINAFTEPVCLALLEYYAFVAEERREKAMATFRTLARVKFREFVYQAVGYSPEQNMLESWRHFHDRIDLTTIAVPSGYFCVFTQVAGMIVSMIRNGVRINDRVIPDISVGKSWSAYWVNNELASKYGERTNYSHEYPDYYPQAKSNPQPAYAYPNEAWATFQEWFHNNYLGDTPLTTYLAGQVKKGTLQYSTANKVLEAFSGKKLSAPKKPVALLK